jgi:cation transport regulator ChaB
VLSASSKTAIAYADCAHRRGANRVVGLTSARNVEFVQGLAVHDDVLTYDQLDDVAVAPSVVIDMAGAGAVVADLHRRLGDLIGHSMVVGKSHHDALPAAVEAGPAPAMFFAPTEIQDRLQEWGADIYRERVSGALHQFIDASHDWLHLSSHLGPMAAQAAWRAVYDGVIHPDDGVIVSLLDD